MSDAHGRAAARREPQPLASRKLTLRQRRAGCCDDGGQMPAFPPDAPPMCRTLAQPARRRAGTRRPRSGTTLLGRLADHRMITKAQPNHGKGMRTSPRRQVQQLRPLRVYCMEVTGGYRHQVTDMQYRRWCEGRDETTSGTGGGGGCGRAAWYRVRAGSSGHDDCDAQRDPCGDPCCDRRGGRRVGPGDRGARPGGAEPGSARRGLVGVMRRAGQLRGRRVLHRRRRP